MSDESIASEQSETHKELRYSIEEQINKYENQIAAYQHTQARQAEIVGDLQSRVSLYLLHSNFIFMYPLNYRLLL